MFWFFLFRFGWIEKNEYFHQDFIWKYKCYKFFQIDSAQQANSGLLSSSCSHGIIFLARFISLAPLNNKKIHKNIKILRLFFFTNLPWIFRNKLPLSKSASYVYLFYLNFITFKSYGNKMNLLLKCYWMPSWILFVFLAAYRLINSHSWTQPGSIWVLVIFVLNLNC